jgi:aminopeptidase N
MRAVTFFLAPVVAGALVACSAPESARPAAPSSPAPAPTLARPQAPDPEPPALRLPGDVKPTSYALDLSIVPAQSTVPGRVHIAATVVRPTRVVWLNATDLVIEHAELAGATARVIKGDNDFFALTLDRELPVGELTIDVAFKAALDRERSRGMYSEHEGADTYVYTFFEETDARRAFPCFDEPAYKVPWQLTFHVKADQVALTNAPTVRETPEADGMKRVETAVSRPLPSYLVAFVVGPFEVIDGGAAGRLKTPIRFVIPKGRAGELDYAKEVTPKVLVALENYFDMDYPFAKLDVAVVPRYWGTMEHPGIVAMGQPLTLIRPDQATRPRKQRYANILAHEMSHYWFGDIVTMAWWDDTWLNEALGKWSDLNITEAAEPDWRFRDGRIDTSISAMRADETLSTRAIRQPVTTREGIGASFDNAITYDKGASMFRMYESLVGREPWRKFIHNYMVAHAWGNASADDFLANLSEALGARVTESLRTFLEQPGVPRISAVLRCEAHQPPRIELSQERSLRPGVVDPQPKLWDVPVCVRYGDASTSHRQCVQLTDTKQTFALEGEQPAGGATALLTRCPTWTILNADAVGYYRSKVDARAVRALLTASSPAARAAKPTPAERMMLIHDLRDAATRDEVPVDQAIAMVPVIAADPDDKVARMAPEAVSLPLTGVDDALWHAARRWYSKTFGPRARQLGWQRGAKDSEERQDLRKSLLWMVVNDDPALKAEARRLTDRWLADRGGLPDDVAYLALEGAAYRSDAARFDRYLAAAKAARDRTEQGRLLATLAAFASPELADKALAVVLGHELDLRETIGIVNGVLQRRETRDVGLAFVTAHFDELLARMRSDDAARFLGSVAGVFCDADRRAKVAALVTPRAAKFEGADNAVKRGLELADQCIALTQRELPAMQRVFGAK